MESRREQVRSLLKRASSSAVSANGTVVTNATKSGA